MEWEIRLKWNFLRFTRLKDQGTWTGSRKSKISWQATLSYGCLSEGRRQGETTYTWSCSIEDWTHQWNISPGHICAVSGFSLTKFCFCFPYLLSLFSERDSKFTVADGTFSDTLSGRPVGAKGQIQAGKTKITKIPFYFILLLSFYFFIWEGERVRVCTHVFTLTSGGSGGRGRGRGRSRLPADVGSVSGLQERDLSWRQTLTWLSHPGAPKILR